MMDILQKIVATKKEEIVARKKVISVEQMRDLCSFNRVCFSMKAALRRSRSGIIAEFKRRSPSKGLIYENALVESIIPNYIKSGAAAVSILTDKTFFAGTVADLVMARSLSEHTPLLRKDFMVDEFQFYESKAMGSDVVLLIAAVLERGQCADFASLAHELGMEVLLEVHSEEELEYVCPNVDIVGVNNRNLKTFETDVQMSEDLVKFIPSEYLKISESGISRPEVVKALRNLGYQGFLMGECFMKETLPAEKLRQFILQL